MDNSSFRLLKAINKLNLSDKGMKRFAGSNYAMHRQYLSQQGFITRVYRDEQDDIGQFIVTDKWTITVPGKAFLANERRSRVRAWVPIVISIIALAFSAIALYMQLFVAQTPVS